MYGVNDAAAAAASITHAEPVPATCIGAVVGSKGSGLRHLRETSGCAVEVPREEDAYGNRHVKLTGAPDRVQLGVALLQDMILQISSGSYRGPTPMPMPLPPPPNAAGKRKLDALAPFQPPHHTGLLPPAPAHAASLAPPYGVPGAFGVAASPFPALSLPHLATALPPVSQLLPAKSATAAIRVLVDSSKVTSIVERGGAGLKQLRESSGASLELMREPLLGGRLLCISPPFDAALKCLGLLCGKLGSLDRPAEAVRSDVVIDPRFPDAAAAAVNPAAPTPAASAAAARAGPPELTIRLLFAGEAVGRLIGKGGAGLRALREKHGVGVDLPRQTQHGDEVRVLTLSGDVVAVYSAACDALVAMRSETPIA